MGYSKASDTERVPNDGSESQRNSAFRFLDLPQELRDKVYKGLLCPHVDGTRHRCHEKIRDYGLEPAVLRTCKQGCHEAWRVLYTENGTVLIRMDAQVYHIFRTARSQARPAFPEVYPIARVECGNVGGVPVLTVEISVLRKYQAKGNFVPGDQVVFVGLLSALPKIAGILKLVVHMERPIGRRPETRLQMLSDCLECLSEGRGPGRAIILTEPQHSATAAKVAKLMKIDMVTFEDVSRITCLQNALDFFDLPQYRLRASRLIGATDKRRHELEVKMIDIQWNYVTCCLKAGRTGDVHHQVRQMFRYCSPQNRTSAQQEGYWGRVADAHYAIGKAYVIDGALNFAAVDHVEERVNSSSKPEDVIVKLNIKWVLKEVRHRVPDLYRLTEDQEKDLVRGFLATYGEIQGLLCDKGRYTLDPGL
ncbi:hypothetical protein HO133_004121 [Letharia lupina]|uniref:Uncharacterized protein n=1 Tax=Letharia lupina TaxID=560253 RepID=A0A8H6F8X2_9LECA|nr:uncharacterized protein HO133_004121 [Letharia lupina]KAF6219652.1 hypothetical protein HO133_004121 [Letharia lupina]